MNDVSTQRLDCDEVASQIWDWLDRELDAARWAAIEEHLATCTGCSEHVAFARGFLNRVSQTSAPADVTSLRSRIRSALATVRAD